MWTDRFFNMQATSTFVWIVETGAGCWDVEERVTTVGESQVLVNPRYDVVQVPIMELSPEIGQHLARIREDSHRKGGYYVVSSGSLLLRRMFAVVERILSPASFLSNAHIHVTYSQCYVSRSPLK